MSSIKLIRETNNIDVKWPSEKLVDSIGFRARSGNRIKDYLRDHGIEGLSLRELMGLFLPPASETWRSKLRNVLTKELSPDAFERLVKRLLRESGFVQVEVTGRTGDGGIDGKGIIRVGGLLSFHVLFQCKKYQGPVSAEAIRDFRGALIGRADKGLFVTTGTFTRDAMREATRDGATPIDLMDGDQLADKLKELRLGIKTEMVESVDIDPDWFKNI